MCPKRLKELWTNWGRGDQKIELRTDKERAIKSVAMEVKKLRAPAATIIEEAPKGDSQSAGLGERANLSSEGLSRTLIDFVEYKLGTKLSVTDPIVAWIVRHSAWLHNKYQQGDDGMTPHRRIFGVDYIGRLLHIGECC